MNHCRMKSAKQEKNVFTDNTVKVALKDLKALISTGTNPFFLQRIDDEMCYSTSDIYVYVIDFYI